MKDRPAYFWGNVYCGATPAVEGLSIDSRTVEEAKAELAEKARKILNKALEEL